MDLNDIEKKIVRKALYEYMNKITNVIEKCCENFKFTEFENDMIEAMMLEKSIVNYLIDQFN